MDILNIGDKVEKVSGDYKFPGEVRAVFTTKKGKLRYVVECEVPKVSGILHIFAPSQIAKT